MFSQRLSKIICVVFLMILLLIISCDDFKEETYKIDSVDDIGIEAITDNAAAETIKPMTISWSDSLQTYTVINIGLTDTFEVTTIGAIWDTLMKYETEVLPVDSRIVQAFDTAGVVFSVDTVLLALVDSHVDQVESNPSVDSIFVSVPSPNYFMTVGGNLNGYSVAYRSLTAGKLNIYSNNFVDFQVIEISSMDSTYIIPTSIPLEMIAEYYTLSDNNLPDPLLKSYVSIELENKDYIIQLKKTETTINSGKTYFSLVTE